MNNLINLNKRNMINFGANIIIGGQKTEKPTPYTLFSGTAKKIDVTEDGEKRDPQEEIELCKSLIQYINILQPISGPIHPTLKTEESPLSVTEQKIGPPPKVSEDLSNKFNNYVRKNDFAFKQAGILLGDQYKDEIDELHKKTMATSKDSPEFKKRAIELNEFFAKGLNAEINIESGRLDKIAKSNEATIFVVDHFSSPYDISLAFAFYSELYKAYDKQGKSSDCPLPKFIINKLAPDNFPPKLKETFEKVEGATIDAMPYPTKEAAKFNKPIMDPVIEGFIKDKNNILIFPEGTRAGLRGFVPVDQRFQYGIGKIVQKALNDKDRVKIVSLGVYGNEKQGAIHIGKPLYFEKDGDKIKVSGGNITPDNEYAKKNSFYKKMSNLKEDEKLTICHKGEPIKTIENPESNEDKKNNKFAARLIAGVLCADMDTCANIAIDKLNKEKSND